MGQPDAACYASFWGGFATLPQNYTPHAAQVTQALASIMALYQTVIFFVPSGFGNREEQVGELFSEEGYFDSEKIWADHHKGVSPLKLANSTFGTENETFWEYYGANDLSIEVNERGVVQCVRARIDGRGYRQGDLKRILSFAHVLECNLFLPEFKKYVEPSKSAMESLSFLLKRSRAAEYAQS